MKLLIQLQDYLREMCCWVSRCSLRTAKRIITLHVLSHTEFP